MSRDPLDVPLHDPALQEEVELMTLLIIAANERATLSKSEIDAIFGLPRQRRRQPSPAGSPRESGATR